MSGLKFFINDHEMTIWEINTKYFREVRREELSDVWGQFLKQETIFLLTNRPDFYRWAKGVFINVLKVVLLD